MKIIHGYLLWRFLASIGIFFVVFCGLFVMIELFELQDYLKPEGETAEYAMLYFFRRLPFLGYLTVPVAILMGAVFTLAWRAHLFETVAAQAAGISVRNLLKPIFGTSVVVTLFLVAGTEFVIPAWSDNADYIRRVHLQKKSPPKREYRDIAFRTGSIYVLVDQFQPVEGRLEAVTMIEPNAEHTAITRVRRIPLLQHVADDEWRAPEDAPEVKAGERVSLPAPRVVELIATHSGYKPLTEKSVEAISLSDLIEEYIVLFSLRRTGDAREKLETEMAQRMAKICVKIVFPLAVPGLALLGAGVGMMLGRRRGILFAVSGALACTLSYMLILQTAVKLSDIAAHTATLRFAAGLIPFIVPGSVGYAAFRVLRRR